MNTSGYSRIPVYDGEIDNIVGIVLAKNVLDFFVEGVLSDYLTAAIVTGATDDDDDESGEEDGSNAARNEENDDGVEEKVKTQEDTKADANDDDSGDEVEEEDDPFLKAIGGADKLLTGEAYQKALLEKAGEV